MNTFTLVVLIILILGFVVLKHLQIKKLKGMIVKIIAGEIENRQLSKLINRAKASNKKKFIIYTCFTEGVLVSIALTIALITLNAVVNGYLHGYEVYLISFLVSMVAFSLTAAIKANSIWRLVNH